MISGKKLSLLDNVNPTKKKLIAQSKDLTIGLGNGNGSVDDPLVVGATVRVVSTTLGAAFDTTYQLPSSGWKYLGKAGQNKGYTYKDSKLLSGPISSAKLAPRQLNLIGKGSGLGYSIGTTNPGPVSVVLAVRGTKYCMTYGGTIKFLAGKSFTGLNAAAPGGCP